MSHYVTVLMPDPDGGYAVLFPDFPGCATQGETQAEAMAAATEALSGHIAAMVEGGEDLPEPRSLDMIRADAAWAKEFEVDWKRATAALTAVRPPLGRPERVSVSLDSNFLRRIDAYAEARGMTRSAALTAGGEMLMASDPLPVMSFKVSDAIKLGGKIKRQITGLQIKSEAGRLLAVGRMNPSGQVVGSGARGQKGTTKPKKHA